MKFVARDDKASQYSWHSVYFHYECEDYVNSVYNKNVSDEEWCAPDLVGGLQPMDEVEDGVYDCMVYNEPAKLFIWTDKELSLVFRFGGGKPDRKAREFIRRGLIVFPGDEKAMKYAQQKMLERATFL